MKHKLCLVLSALTVSALVTASFAKPAALSEAEAKKLAVDAYIYGYPLVTMDVTKQIMTNVEKPNPITIRAPMGQFANADKYPNASFKDVTTPNADTLYSIAWLDLAKEPYVLHVPAEKNRYYMMPMLSGWTDVFAVPGTRTTGTKAQDFVIVGPHWKGKLPKDMRAYRSPTNMVWILGRTYSTGTPEDYQAVHDIQAQYSLTPLSAVGKSYTPPDGTVNSDIDMTTAVRDQVNAMDAATFFKRLAMLLKDNPPAKADATMVTKLAKLGIVPGKDYDLSAQAPGITKGMTDVITSAQQTILEQEKKSGKIKNGWLYMTNVGVYGTDYKQRAFIAAVGLGANRPEDAIYPKTSTDSDGNKLNGANKYVIHFNKGQVPPVKGFWSLTMYNDQYFFVDNPLNKYTVSPRNNLVKNADGSMDIYIQNKSPGKDKEANWLPAPTGDFNLVFRFYWPEAAIINGTWNIPMVKKV